MTKFVKLCLQSSNIVTNFYHFGKFTGKSFKIIFKLGKKSWHNSWNFEGRTYIIMTNIFSKSSSSSTFGTNWKFKRWITNSVHQKSCYQILRLYKSDNLVNRHFRCQMTKFSKFLLSSSLLIHHRLIHLWIGRIKIHFTEFQY